MIPLRWEIFIIWSSDYSERCVISFYVCLNYVRMMVGRCDADNKTSYRNWNLGLGSIFCRRLIFGAKELPLQGDVLHHFVHWRWTKWIPWFAALRTQFRENSSADCSRCVNVSEECCACGSCFWRWWLSSHHFSAAASFAARVRLPAAGFRDCQNCLSHGKTKVLSSRNIWISLCLWSCSYYSCSCSGCLMDVGSIQYVGLIHEFNNTRMEVFRCETCTGTGHRHQFFMLESQWQQPWGVCWGRNSVSVRCSYKGNSCWSVYTSSRGSPDCF